MADYLAAYARDARLPVRAGVRALTLARGEGSYTVETTAGKLEAEHVVIATGYQKPKLPAFAAGIDPVVRQLHASQYRNPSQLVGDVLVVGAGTSGVEIAIEAARAGHHTVLAGRGTGSIPPIFYAFKGRVFWFYANRIASVRTPIGRKMKPLVLSHGAPLIRVKMRDAIAAGVERSPRVAAVENGVPVLEGGRRLQADTIVWCTGFGRDYSWIQFPVAGPDGYPRHSGGVADGERGLYFVGLPYQTRLASGLIGGVGEDARSVAAVIAGRLRHSGELQHAGTPAVELAPAHS
jgi:putative flavoprotein involved in K+ transport